MMLWNKVKAMLTPKGLVDPRIGQPVRWIETRGCMAHIDVLRDTGVVTGIGEAQFYGMYGPRPMLEFQWDKGIGPARWPADAFLISQADGALEYRY